MRKAYCIMGLGFGDESKGAACQFLCEQYNADVIVKYSGGCQSAHNVVDETGRRFVFSQIGATLRDNVSTYLWRNFIVDPLAMLNEANALKDFLGNGKDPLRNVYVHPDCPIVMPYHVIQNRRSHHDREILHGTCGRGIGECREESRKFGAHTAKDCSSGLQPTEQFSEWAARVRIREYPPDFETAVFEGSQGILLDESVGFHPHTTWSTVRFDAAHACYRHLGIHDWRNIGVIRTYHTRHGAGPFPTERDLGIIDPGNPANEYQGSMRYGDFDRVLFDYAIANAGDNIHALAITHCDQPRSRFCSGYNLYDGRFIDNLPHPSCIEDQIELCEILKSVESLKFENGNNDLSSFTCNYLPLLYRSYGPKLCDKEVIAPNPF